MKGRNETTGMDFILLGLFPDMKHSDIMISVIILIYVVAFTGNSTLILLILVDSQLHTPMYLLLSQLSLIDLLFISTTVPKMATDFFSGNKHISNTACGTQIFFYLLLGEAECILLTLMACDRYLAICRPLRYPLIMNKRVCQMMVMVSWVGGPLNSIGETAYTMHLPTCGDKEIEHFFCELTAILRFSCKDTSSYRFTVLVLGITLLLIPFVIIFTSYTIVFLTVLRMNSPQGRNKALATCSSHLIVVSLFYGPVIFTYMTPGFSHSPDQDKTVSVFFAIVTPMLNPFIYSLRNKDVLRALNKVLKRGMIPK
ncbi:olfactory receptor 2M2-like [Hippopotamus amphibius kiboko]|uniref:olfactory receptor 2M2-like n=1 Tax=Hippopotamus amphibius kiboko TaxID=575201 RepID=UPI0025927844|nr:olfactory receptor 2M2-like [Hippopotamus amphibius kiboko]